MSDIGYSALGDIVADILNDAIEEVQIVVEEDVNFAAEATPWIGVYLTGRRRSETQPLAAGKVLRYELDFSLLCMTFTVEGRRQAAVNRNVLISQVEIALLQNQTLRDNVEYIILQGGEMQVSQTPGDVDGFVGAGEVNFTAVATIRLT